MTRPGSGGREVSLHFGALAPTIRKQVPELNARDAAIYQGNADAITRLVLHGLLTDGEARKARQRLINSIAETVAPVRDEKEGGDVQTL